MVPNRATTLLRAREPRKQATLIYEETRSLMASIQFPVSDDFEILVDIHAASSFESAGGTTKSEDEILGIIRLKRPRILIVDNEDRFRRSLAFKLQARYNAVVEEAETGAEALD